jgi:integrase
MAIRDQQAAADFYLSPSEIKRLIFACDNFRDRCMIKLLAYSGMRREELQQLDVQDIDFERKRIYIRSGKGGKSRTIPASESVLADLKHLIHNRKKGPLFLSQKGGRLSLRQVNRIVAKAGKSAGLKHPDPKRKAINPHLLRHSFGRNALKAGMPMEQVQQILGHASIKTTIDIYGVPSVDDTQEQFERRIEGLYG